MKAGIVSTILAREILCKTCKEPCVNDVGSYMITYDNHTVTCEYCRTQYSVPGSAFRAKLRRKVATNQV